MTKEQQEFYDKIMGKIQKLVDAIAAKDAAIQELKEQSKELSSKCIGLMVEIERLKVLMKDQQRRETWRTRIINPVPEEVYENDWQRYKQQNNL